MNRFNIRILCFILSFLMLNISVMADGDDEDNLVKKLILQGKVKDKKSGEELIGATIFIKELQTGTASNMDGIFQLNLKPGEYTLVVSYVGYKPIGKTLRLSESTNITIELSPRDQVLDEVVVSATQNNENITKTEMSSFKMEMADIKKIPALMGEVDVIKAVQLLPGVSVASEGSSGFSVRGGSIDQNLILLDKATIYNASHLMGFFSVFNNDAVEDVTLYKGDMPASSGGRLSSLLDVEMREGSYDKIHATGGVGLISSRLTLEGPVFSDNTSFIISGRRTYADLFLPLARNEDLHNNQLYFYDLNGKISHRINEYNKITLSAYNGRDIFGSEFFEMGFGNQSVALNWNHVFNTKLSSNYTLIRTVYNYKLGVPEGEANSFEWKSDILDYTAKAGYTWYPNDNHKIQFGLESTFHNFKPGEAKGLGEEAFFQEFAVPDNNSLEHAVYASNEHKIGSRLTLKYGIRFSMFNNYKATQYNYDDAYNVIDSTVYDNEIFNTYYGFEPRLGLNYVLNDVSSLKASYAKTRQYVHLAQNSTAGTPLDVWFPSSPNVKPQIADQVAIGYFRNLFDHKIETSVEAYYKKMDNVIDFRDHANLLLNPKMEGELRFGEATSYGLEFLVRFNDEKLSGWVSYTLSKTERTIPEINNGKAYSAPYDKPHDVAIVLNYEIHPRHVISTNWVYSSGNPVTLPSGRFEYGGLIAPVYTNRNAYRMPDYHRLDVSYTFKSKSNPNKRFEWDLNVSCYNVYGRKNAWSINFQPDENDPSKMTAVKTYLFAQVPSVTFNFKF